MIALTPAGAQQTAGLADGLTRPLSALGRTALETGVDLAASALARSLQQSRDRARQAGTRSIPPHILAALLASYPAALLDTIEYRVGAGEEATLQSYSIRYGDAIAVATIDTITFANASDAANNLALWAHEVEHVAQFHAWGVLEFAHRYIRDHQAVEHEAEAAAARFSSGNGGG